MSQSYAFDSESDSESGFAEWGMPSAERLKADAERAAMQRSKAIERALLRRAYWVAELFAERFDEFRIELRRRVAVEDETIDRLQEGELIMKVLRQHQAEAVHHGGGIHWTDQKARELIQSTITEISAKQRKLRDELANTPKKMLSKVNQIWNDLEDLDEELVEAKGKLRKLN